MSSSRTSLETCSKRRKSSRVNSVPWRALNVVNDLRQGLLFLFSVRISTKLGDWFQLGWFRRCPDDALPLSSCSNLKALSVSISSVMLISPGPARDGSKLIQPREINVELLEPRVIEANHLRNKGIKPHEALEKLPKLLLRRFILIHLKALNSQPDKPFQLYAVLCGQASFIELLCELLYLAFDQICRLRDNGSQGHKSGSGLYALRELLFQRMV